MAKNKLLLVDLNDKKTKKLAETITSSTSRKILDYLADKDDTEQNMAKELRIPISTIHYHLQKLVEASLVVADEFHYSKKGREVNHYKLANKYIIITPKKITGIKQKLKNILPVGLVILGVSGIIKLATQFTTRSMGATPLMEKAVMTAPTAAKMKMDAVGAVENAMYASPPDIALWFLIGGMSAVLVYVLVVLVRSWLKK